MWFLPQRACVISVSVLVCQKPMVLWMWLCWSSVFASHKLTAARGMAVLNPLKVTLTNLQKNSI
ncbi:MAG: hypothetical protein U1F01_05200 [Acinetobacter sp.]